MVKLTKIYTRTGDGGESGLVDGTRLSKADARFAAIGDVDEANAAIGLAISALAVDPLTNDPKADADAVRTLLQGVQNDLFDLGADLATPTELEGALRLRDGASQRLEDEIDRLSHALGPLENFVLPGGSEAGARLHLARTQVRRAERTVIGLHRQHALNPEILKYLNRLSDLLFQLARHLNDDGAGDVLWVPGGQGGS